MEQRKLHFRKPCSELFAIEINKETNVEFILPKENIRFFNSKVNLYRDCAIDINDINFFSDIKLKPIDIKLKLADKQLICFKEEDQYVITGIVT